MNSSAGMSSCMYRPEPARPEKEGKRGEVGQTWGGASDQGEAEEASLLLAPRRRQARRPGPRQSAARRYPRPRLQGRFRGGEQRECRLVHVAGPPNNPARQAHNALRRRAPCTPLETPAPPGASPGKQDEASPRLDERTRGNGRVLPHCLENGPRPAQEAAHSRHHQHCEDECPLKHHAHQAVRAGAKGLGGRREGGALACMCVGSRGARGSLGPPLFVPCSPAPRPKLPPETAAHHREQGSPLYRGRRAAAGLSAERAATQQRPSLPPGPHLAAEGLHCSGQPCEDAQARGIEDRGCKHLGEGRGVWFGG